jgi:hypothetical protein
LLLILAVYHLSTGLQSDLHSHSIEPIYAVDYAPSRLLTSLHLPSLHHHLTASTSTSCEATRMLYAPRMCGILTTINMTSCFRTRGSNLGALETVQAHTAQACWLSCQTRCHCLRIGTLALVFSKSGTALSKTQVPMV